MKLGKTLITEEEIRKRVKEIAGEIDMDYRNEEVPLVLVGVLKGSFIFLSDLSRNLHVHHIVDFIAVSSYGNRGDKRGEVRLMMDTRENLTGCDVLIVEDILDSGRTLKYLSDFFSARGARSVNVAAFLDKSARHSEDAPSLKYRGFEIGDSWVVGYGLDYKEKYRTLPYIAELTEKD